MKVLVLYRPQSEHARRTEEFVENIKRQHGVKLDVVDVDSRDGVATASMYDIMLYPAVLVMTLDGRLIKLWSGEEVPPMPNEVVAYTFS
ncbi:hypothetical protein A3D14_01770 [Candidatus Saccharibacteria bacterium RIFCSPHIGHO2_02_FULL_47_12]|nr:MAG: hypothetical protein A3D14_01770 [Candidatus Saccharibacteria bacterium RIFCSPHIGHO2_02_FULL_47_12]